MKLTSAPLAVIVFVLLFGGIGFSSAMNWWQTESRKQPVTYSEGQFAGQYNPADIRGSYTFGEISALFDIPLSDLHAAFRIPVDSDPAAYQVKSLEAQFADLPIEMGTASVRLFAAFYKGLPYEFSADEETYLFPEAAEVLKASGKMTAEQASYLEGHIFQEETVAAPAAATAVESAPAAEETGPEATPAPTEHAAPERTITGKTTFQELLDWGLTKEAIEQVLGDTMPAPQMLVKDYSTAKGTAFSELKGDLQAEVDQLK